MEKKNNLDPQYNNLLKDILENGIKKQTRNGEVLSLFGKQIRHNMKDGFPLLTGKKMFFKGIVTELLWFLRGDTNIKYLVDNNCHIWDGDAYKNYKKKVVDTPSFISESLLDEDHKKWFINKIKTDDDFAKKWGELGPIYGSQWRSWKTQWYQLVEQEGYTPRWAGDVETEVDQIQNLINNLKTNPDSRRLVVSAWNVGELDGMVLPPCHYGFQVYTRELTWEEQVQWVMKNTNVELENLYIVEEVAKETTPKRAISLMWNQRSVDTFLGLPFNIASYGLLLEIIAKMVNMVPDELIGNLGDVHLYSNHVEQAKEQIGRELTLEERVEKMFEINKKDTENLLSQTHPNHVLFDNLDVPKRTREPFDLPTLNINTEFWQTESKECGEGPLDATAVLNSFKDDNFCKCLLEEDLQLINYQSHPTIKAPLSN